MAAMMMPLSIAAQHRCGNCPNQEDYPRPTCGAPYQREPLNNAGNEVNMRPADTDNPLSGMKISDAKRQEVAEAQSRHDDAILKSAQKLRKARAKMEEKMRKEEEKFQAEVRKQNDRLDAELRKILPASDYGQYTLHTRNWTMRLNPKFRRLNRISICPLQESERPCRMQQSERPCRMQESEQPCQNQECERPCDDSKVNKVVKGPQPQLRYNQPE